MVARKQTSIKVDPIAWESAKAVFKEYNLTLSDAINIFLNKVRLEQGMPFDIKVPSKQLDMAMKESKNNEGSFHDTLD
ncbi:MAG: type II toxin-antitoxin system RelB/DinJ family antitoxin, partial [Sulfuricurvum sp.]